MAEKLRREAANRPTNQLSPIPAEHLLTLLQTRFEKHLSRHAGLAWPNVRAKLQAHPEKLWSLQEMERTGGEPDLVALDQTTGEFVFYDCSPETPSGRRSLCYDHQALESRKQNRPAGSAQHMAATMGIVLLNEQQYRHLQSLGEFDTKTSSWIETPPRIRKLGGALFGDRRYDTVFVYHNGAESYFGARAFRASLRV